MKRYTSEEIKEFVSSPLFDEKVILNKNPSWPKVSIVTPSYNQAEFLERTILSVLNQNYPNIEYIIIDGGSTDGSVEIIKQYGKYLTYWVSEADEGQADAVNKGFMKSTGEIIGWQNSDDIYLPDSLIKAATVFIKESDVDIVFGNTLLINEGDITIDEIRFTPFTILAHMYEGMSINNQSSFWQRRLFLKIGMLKTQFHFAMDYEFFLRAASTKAKFRHIRDYLGAFRLQKKSKTATIVSVSYKECGFIDNIYSKNKLMSYILKTVSLFRRSLYYIVQGDADYFLKGITKRLFKYKGF